MLFRSLSRREANSPAAATRMMIIPDDVAINNNEQAAAASGFSDLLASVDTNTWIMIAIGSAGVFAVVGLVVVLAVLIRRHRSKSVTMV